MQEDNVKAPNPPVITNDRFRNTTGEDKPYNGYAWYRKRLTISDLPSWKGKDLVLSCGKVQNWCRVYMNGKPLEPIKQEAEQRRITRPDQVLVPAALVKFGQTNTIAIQVYNHDNFGGIVSGPVALYVQGQEPTMRETAGPMSIVQEWTRPGDYYSEYAILTGSMSPAVLVSGIYAIHLRDWEARGYPAPTSLQYMTQKGIRTVDATPAMYVNDITEKWLVLRGAAGSTLIVPATLPRSICPTATAARSTGLRINFNERYATAAVIHFPPGCEARHRSLPALGQDPAALSHRGQRDRHLRSQSAPHAAPSHPLQLLQPRLITQHSRLITLRRPCPHARQLRPPVQIPRPEHPERR